MGFILAPGGNGGLKSKRRCKSMPEVKNSYETVFILSTKLGEEGIAATVNKFKELIAAHGTIDNVDEWGKRRLAYPINKEEEGYYTLISFTSAPEFTAELDRVYNITDGVLRSLIVKKEKEAPSKPKAEEKKEA
jgi:small subunit ribosomal protein S6